MIVLEADYSAALTLLLKYPVPDPPHGPRTFVEDAIYLRENLNPVGARKIITTYSGRTPQHYASTSRPATPSGAALSLDQKTTWRRSQLPSPARFLQHQGGVEALLQGAAKGVFERGERLGINKAVRDAVGEVKKNMQNLQTPSPPSIRRSPDVMRRSLDESRAVLSTRKTIASIEQRNKQLSQMLDDTLNDLRSLSAVEVNTTSNSTYAIDLAIAKLQFVQVYLEDSSIPLPTEPSQNIITAKSLPKSTSISKTLQANKEPLLDSEHKDSLAQSTSYMDNPPQAKVIEAPVVPKPSTSPSSSTTPSESSGGSFAIPARPRAPIPTRSTLAQSSFAFMLEPDESSITSAKSSSPMASSPFLASGKRPLSGGSREKAFLFGGEPEDGEQSPWSPSAYSGTNQEYNLGTIKGSKGG
jgi:TBC1 domain family protein 5